MESHSMYILGLASILQEIPWRSIKVFIIFYSWVVFHDMDIPQFV